MSASTLFQPSSRRTPGRNFPSSPFPFVPIARASAWVPAFAGMTKRGVTASLLLLASLASTNAFAQDVLIRHATVHTAGAQGTLQDADVLVQGGIIRAVGSNLPAPASITVIEANGKPLTPALFGGITEIGIEEVSGEAQTVDSALTLARDQPLRPEFDVTLAYNPDSVLVPIARVEGLGFTLLGASTGGSFIAGQGGVLRLDGSADPIGPRVLFVKLGNEVLGQSGSSRAAQWMLLDQIVGEARGRIPADSPHALLTPTGRVVLARYLAGNGRIVITVNRAADIRQLLRWAQREKVSIAIASGAEAWKLAPQIAQAKVPVFVDALADLPGDFDQIGATLENAARLHAAGVEVSFAQFGDASHNARKIRQYAGNAVANGLPWEAGLAGLTRVPAQVLGVSDRLGTIAPGKLADLVLWSGDPLDVANVAQQLWLGGQAIPMRSRQTELRDRYLPAAGSLPRAYTP